MLGGKGANFSGARRSGELSPLARKFPLRLAQDPSRRSAGRELLEGVGVPHKEYGDMQSADLLVDRRSLITHGEAPGEAGSDGEADRCDGDAKTPE